LHGQQQRDCGLDRRPARLDAAKGNALLFYLAPLLRTFRATADSAVLAAVTRLEGFSQSGMEPVTFRLMAQRLHQLRHRAAACPLFQSISGNIRFT